MTNNNGGYMSEHPPEEKCAICYGGFVFPCRTSCSHWFCGRCFLDYWQSKGRRYYLNCPMCVRKVKKLKPYSLDLLPHGEEGQLLMRGLIDYNNQKLKNLVNVCCDWCSTFMKYAILVLLITYYLSGGRMVAGPHYY